MSLSRIEKFNYIKNKFLNQSFYSTICKKISTSLRGHLSLNNEVIYLNKGTWGFIFKVKLKENKFIKLKIQIMPNNIFTKFKGLNDPRNVNLEKFIFEECNNLILKNVTCNLPLYYKSILCKNEKFKTMIFLTELSDNTLPNWILEKHTDLEWESFLFQILSTLHVFKKYLKFFHNDMNINNILVNKDKNKGYYNYNINTVSYYIPTTGYIFLIWDYANGYSLLQKNDEKIVQNLRNNDDFEKFSDTFKLMKMNNIYNSVNFEELNNILEKNIKNFSELKNKQLKNINIKFKHVKNQKKRKFKIKRSLHKSFCYYAIENDLYELIMQNKKKNFKYNIIPSKKINTLIENIFIKDKKLSIPNIIEKYFSKFKNKPNEDMILEIFNQ